MRRFNILRRYLLVLFVIVYIRLGKDEKIVGQVEFFVLGFNVRQLGRIGNQDFNFITLSNKQSYYCVIFTQKFAIQKQQNQPRSRLFALIRRPRRQSNDSIDGDDAQEEDSVRAENLDLKLKSAFENQARFSSSSSSSTLYSLDPYCDEANAICCGTLKLTENQMVQIQILCDAVVQWNERINLVSRKDCSTSTVFGRHVLPSLVSKADPKIDAMFSKQSVRVIDVGTGGGFPGLPLAIAYPETKFVLLDSINKKLLAVQDMANQLGLKNVEIVNQRSESYIPKPRKFDIVTGRSVTALPQFCSWIHTNLLDSKAGYLVYWIGGDINSSIEQRLHYKASVQSILLNHNVTSDKQVLVLPYKDVQEVGLSHTSAVLEGQATKVVEKRGRLSTRIHSDRRRDTFEMMTFHRRDSTMFERPSSSSLSTNGRKERSKPNKQTTNASINENGRKRTLAKGEWRKKSRDVLADDDRVSYPPQPTSYLDSSIQSSSSGDENFQRYSSRKSSTGD